MAHTSAVAVTQPGQTRDRPIADHLAVSLLAQKSVIAAAGKDLKLAASPCPSDLSQDRL
jgi:hypothetical protein